LGELWAYCRVSTTKEEQEESLDAQAGWAEELAREKRCKLHVVREQASAKTTIGRPRFNAMMADLAGLPKAQRPQYLMITALDRLSRNTRDTLNVIEALRELKVTLYERGLGPITAEDFPRLAALVGMSLAGEAENYARSVRMRQSREKRRAEGKPTSNKVPYRLQLRGGRDVVVPDSGAWVLRAFQWYGTNGLGMYKIARRFAEGARTTRGSHLGSMRTASVFRKRAKRRNGN
jgi:DNA invertase Pin-like site-specific DNA recombinase